MDARDTSTQHQLEVLGAEITSLGPIQRCFVPLDSPVTVLYGLNGAGKTHVLTALSAAFQNDAEFKGMPAHGEVRVFVHTLNWKVDFLGSDDWSPWDALYEGAIDSIRQTLVDEHGANPDMDSLLQQLLITEVPYLLRTQTHRSEVREFLEYLEACGDGSLDRRLNDLNHLLGLLALFTIAAGPTLFVEIDRDDDRVKLTPIAEAEPFVPVMDAFFARRLVVSRTNDRRRIGLCTDNEGPETRRWGDRVTAAIRSKVDFPWDARLIHSLEEFHREGVAHDEILAFVTATLESEDEEHPVDEDDNDRQYDSGMPLAKAIAGYEREGASAFIDLLCDEFPDFSENLIWDSAAARALDLAPPPPWASDTVLNTFADPGALPFILIQESQAVGQLQVVHELATRRRANAESEREELLEFVAATQRAADRLRGVLHRRVRGELQREVAGADELRNLIVEVDGTVEVDADLKGIAKRLAEVANEVLGLLLPNAPQLECWVASVLNWHSEGPIAWGVIEENGKALPASALSDAQYRWASFSLRLADAVLTRPEGQSILVLIDEPERAMHRRAERRLAAGLVEVAARYDARLVMASHSPVFLSISDAARLHVRRDQSGHTVTEPVPLDFFERSAELGLDPVDLLQMRRAVLLVEGQHEVVILDEMLGTELRTLGVEVLCMRGATALKAWDAQLIERYTDLPFVVLVDNDRAGRLSEVWDRARDAAAAGQDHLAIVDELKSGAKGGEGEFLRELCKNLISHGTPGRYHITAFEKPDVPEYLAPSAIAPAVGDKTWSQLRVEAENHGAESGRFKRWMQNKYAADYSNESLRAAAASMDSVPTDFVALLDVLASVIEGSR